MSQLRSEGNFETIRRGRHRSRKGARTGLLAAAAAIGALTLGGPAHAQKITSSIYADDEFKVFISTSAATAGVEFAQGAGWSINFQNHLYVYGGTTTYFLHVWVRDIGGGPTGFLGQFRLTNHRGCRFANGSTLLLTGANGLWQVSARQPASTPITGGPLPSVPYFNNVIPKFAVATMMPSSLGANTANGNSWPSSPTPKPFAGVSSAAHWIGGSSSAGGGAGPELWFTTRIICKTANLGSNVNPN